MNKTTTAQDALSRARDGMTILIGGFLNNGTPMLLIDALLDAGASHLTIIANDSGFPGQGIGKLIDAGRVDALITSHIGTNPVTGRRMHEGTLRVELVPQGTLIERIRAGGAGLGGVLTPTGLGTQVQDGKRVIDIEGRSFLLEMPLRGDIALVRATIADEAGNLYMRGTTRNFNPMIATAAEYVVAAAEQVVPVGALEPDRVVTPGLFVDAIVGGEPHVG